MEKLQCVVDRITYRNEANGYTVLKVKVKGHSEISTVVGTMTGVHVGSELLLEGQWKVTPKYGKQFTVASYQETMPATVYGIEKYLGSGLIKGIGPTYAKKIVERFKEQTLDIIEKDPDRLKEIEGLGDRRIEQIRKSLSEQKEVRDIMIFLQGHDVSTSQAARIYKAYGSKSIEVIKENPYRLADDIWGFGFKTADSIAEKMKVGKERFVRLRSGILYTLNQLAAEGNCYADRNQLVELGTKILGVEDNLLQMTIDEMIHAQDIFRDGDALYLPVYYYAETGVAKRIIELLHTPSLQRIDLSKSGGSSIKYDEIQMQAIQKAATSKFMVLTGGPGTGKTTTVKGIIDLYQTAGRRILLAAPTGRAAKRMSEATGMEAKTIHRLLEYKIPDGYQKDEKHPLKGDVLILDECSMIDILLMFHLLKAVPNNMTVILVGDTDQLPSVGAGNVLNDIIQSDAVDVVRLQHIFRQALGSLIITNAHRIDQGKYIEANNEANSDFFFIEKKDSKEILDFIIQYVSTNLPRHYHADPIRDIQVLTPMQKGEIGAINLNNMLQAKLNPSGTSVRYGGYEYRVNDKVMQIRNDYDKDAFNGDIGLISGVNPGGSGLTVNFDGREVEYDITELDELVLAYACTIHKSQGSEYPIVVMPVSMSHYIMLQRNLLYTGVTRAKKVLILVGEKRAVSFAIRNQKPSMRNTKLSERLSG